MRAIDLPTDIVAAESALMEAIARSDPEIIEENADLPAAPIAVKELVTLPVAEETVPETDANWLIEEPTVLTEAAALVAPAARGFNEAPALAP
jgi:hypothetical protein